MAQTLLEPFDLNGKLILADKGYDSDKFVRWLEERGGVAVIPSRIIAKHPRKTDWHTYKERHLVENLFLKLKNNRRFATRYEKKALYFRAVVCLACILVGPVGIVFANSLLGEITPAIATAVGASRAFKILIPVNRCNHFIAGCTENPLGEYIRLAVEQLETMLPS